MNEQVKIISSSHNDNKFLATGSLILGLVSIPSSFVLFGALIGLLGIVFGVWHWLRKSPGRIMSGFGIGLSCAGIVLSGCMLALYIWMYQEIQTHFESSPQTYDPWIGVKVPAMVLTDLDGSEISLSQLRGKRVVLNFWATWCPPCKKEIPHLIQLQDEYENDVVIIGISHEATEIQKPFAEEHGINYVLGTVEDLPEPFFSVHSIPTTFFIDRNGVIQHYTIGYRDYHSIKTEALRDDYAGEVLEMPNEIIETE